VTPPDDIAEMLRQRVSLPQNTLVDMQPPVDVLEAIEAKRRQGLR